MIYILSTKFHKDMNTATTTEKQIAAAKGRDCYLAVAYILGLDRRRYGKYLEDLHNNFIQGKKKYPKLLIVAYNISLGWKCDPRNMIQVTGNNSSNDGVVFATVNETTKRWKAHEIS